MKKEMIEWTVKSNSEIGRWEKAESLLGAKRAARAHSYNVISPTQAIIRVDGQELYRLGWYAINNGDKWQDII